MFLFWQIINKFYKIRQQTFEGKTDGESGCDDQYEDVCWDEKCAWLCNDPPESWSFNVYKETTTAAYVVSSCSFCTLFSLFCNKIISISYNRNLEVDSYVASPATSLVSYFRAITKVVVLVWLNTLVALTILLRVYVLIFHSTLSQYLKAGLIGKTHKLSVKCKSCCTIIGFSEATKKPWLYVVLAKMSLKLWSLFWMI